MFEEEVKRPSNASIESFSKRDVSFEKLASKFNRGAQTLKEWKEYAFKAEDRIRELESQLDSQQSNLPEVPQFVADWYEENKEDLEYQVYLMNVIISKKENTAMSQIQFWFNDEENKPLETIFAMKNGYTVAKEERFYLKNKLTGLYLCESRKGFFEQENPTLELTSRCDFTQQEIDNMDTGSYEQIEVQE